MGKYGKAAVIATDLLSKHKVDAPVKAWELAVDQVFPDSESSRRKGCPKSTFLGLCEDGYISGVERGEYTRSEKNKYYAIKAISLLNSNPMLSEKELWELVIDESEKKHNAQMDVVKTLWDNKLIEKK